MKNILIIYFNKLFCYIVSGQLTPPAGIHGDWPHLPRTVLFQEEDGQDRLNRSAIVYSLRYESQPMNINKRKVIITHPLLCQTILNISGVIQEGTDIFQLIIPY